MIESNKERLIREETLRIQNLMQSRKFKLDSSQDTVPIVDQPPSLDELDLDRHVGFAWVSFDKKSKERKIEIDQLIDKTLPGEFNIKLDCLESTAKKLSLKCAENAD